MKEIYVIQKEEKQDKLCFSVQLNTFCNLLGVIFLWGVVLILKLCRLIFSVMIKFKTQTLF